MPSSRDRPSAAAGVLGRSIRETRSRLGWSQRRLASEARVSQAAVWRLESERGDALPLGSLVNIATALGASFEPVIRPPAILEHRRPRDDVHARLVAYVARRLQREGWATAVEVEIRRGSLIAWVDVLAMRSRDGAVLAVEVKSELVDVGGALRQVGWYTRNAAPLAQERGVKPLAASGALLLLDTRRNHELVQTHAAILRASLPARAEHLLAWIRSPDQRPPPPSLATVDPRARRSNWLAAMTADGRRRAPPYADLAAFRATMGSPRGSGSGSSRK